MVAMNALPPVPSVFGDGWRAEWRRRVDALEPWILRWTEEQTDSAYWRHGSLRPDYGAITAATMIVAGWADGYRNNTFRTYAALTAAGTPVRLIAGPWSHMAAATALPGPHIDLVAEMARWFDRWLRDADTGIGASGDPTGGEPSIVYFGRTSADSEPEPDAAVVAGAWHGETTWPSPRLSTVEHRLTGGVVAHRLRPDTGTAAWNSCAGTLPYGQPTDQRFADAASLTWDVVVTEPTELLGHASLALRVAADRPVASVSARLCDVAPDGTSTLITRGFVNLTHAGGGDPRALTPGAFVDVDLELEATAFTVLPGHRLRLALTGVDWPNVIAPPAPVTLTVDSDASVLRLPVAAGPAAPAPAAIRHLDPPPAGDHSAITWRITDDVLARLTSATVDHGSTYDITGPGSCTDRYAGTVTVDRRTWEQTATSTASFVIEWPEATVRADTSVRFTADAERFGLTVTVSAVEGDVALATRTWERSLPRRLA